MSDSEIMHYRLGMAMSLNILVRGGMQIVKQKILVLADLSTELEPIFQ